MGRSRFDKYAKTAVKAPPLDMAWAVVLVRKEQLDMDLKQIAEAVKRVAEIKPGADGYSSRPTGV